MNFLLNFDLNSRLHSEQFAGRFCDKHGSSFDFGFSPDETMCFLENFPRDGQPISRRCGRSEFDIDFGSNGGDAEAERKFGHGFIEERRKDSAMNNSFISLMQRGRREQCPERPALPIDLEIDGKARWVFFAADVAALVFTERVHFCRTG